MNADGAGARTSNGPSAETFVPAGARRGWPFVVGRYLDGRPPPRSARLLLAWGVVEAMLRLQPKRQRALWRTWPKSALASLMHGPIAGPEHPSRHFVTSLIGTNETVLDVACGAGASYETLHVAGKASRYVGVDSSEPTIEVARELYPSGTFHVGEAEALVRQFGPESFDVVIVRHVLEHLPDFEPAMSEAIAVSRRVVFFVFHLAPRSLPFGVRKVNPRISRPFFTNIYSRPAIERDLDRQRLHRRWHDRLGVSRAAWLVGELNSVLLVSRNPIDSPT